MKLTILAIALLGLSLPALAKPPRGGSVDTKVTATVSAESKAALAGSGQIDGDVVITAQQEGQATNVLASADTNFDGSLSDSEAQVLIETLKKDPALASIVPLFNKPTVKGIQEAATACKI